MLANKDTIKTSSYSTIANDFVAREDVIEPVGNTSQAGEASCSISQAYSYATTIARDYSDEWDSPQAAVNCHHCSKHHA